MPKNFRTSAEQLKPKYIPIVNRVTMKCPDVQPSSSKPIHLRRVEQALNLQPFLQSFNNRSILSSDSDDSDDGNTIEEAENVNSMPKDAEPNSTKEYYNFKNVSASRKWLADVLSEDTENCNEDANYKFVLSLHAYQKKVRRARDRVNFDASLFYGAGLVSVVDHYPEIEKNLPNIKKPKLIFKTEEAALKSPLYEPDILDEISNEPCLELNLENGINEYPNLDEDIGDTPKHAEFHPSSATPIVSHIPQISNVNISGVPKRKTKKFRDEEAKKKWEDMMNIKRRKVFTNIAKKEVGKQHRSKMNKHKEMLLQCKRVASHCVKYARQKALQSAKLAKEQQWRMKRLARENLAYWKRSRRFDREVKKRLEKEAEEQRKIDHELIEAKRQQRKLNFLITQTELYAHFMSKKLGSASAEEQLMILSQLDEERINRIAGDDYNSDEMKEKAKRNAQEAFMSERARTKDFDQEANSCLTDVEPIDGEQPQPDIFTGILKGYQLKGMNWLANLYSQGISGILADEMGLGKTVQSIAFLCHIAEKYSVWGPFLIISPASTLHNWQQEIAKFVPEFKVVPYWGNPNERKILRQFWDQKDIYTKDASFHIVITSYQIVITDIKYFNRIKWQYMILDEAQAIKSTNSMRWKTLLGFSCRNRLLLSGTPIQNSMAELWALLHFIMPTLFDSHEEFNEWFSKDIESHAENKTGIDEKHLSRLHMILKPFMLRRIKKDVENELSDKIEVMVYCPLTTRQNLLYMALKQKIKIEDLLHYSVGGGDSPHTVDKNFTSNLMNLVMQFRKVCNHPELFERRDAKSPIRVQPTIYNIPYLIYDYNVRQQTMLKIKKNFIFTPHYISTAMFDPQSIFYFCVVLNVSPADFFRILIGDIAHRWKHYFETEKQDELLYHRKLWHIDLNSKPTLRLRNNFKLSSAQIKSSPILSDLAFARFNTGNKVIYTHTDHVYNSMPETVEHRNIRVKKESDEENVDVVSDKASQIFLDFPHIPKLPQVFHCEKTELPSFLFCGMPRVSVAPLTLYCYSRRAAWDYQRHINDYSFNSLNAYWSHCTEEKMYAKSAESIYPRPFSCVDNVRPPGGSSNIVIPDKESLVTDSGKLSVLDGLLRRLKEEGHRVLIYSQMTKMIDLLEEYMWHRHHKYMRLDGSSKISERRDMVADFQARTDIFVFLLSTRAGGLGINLTAADTVIFYDSDWNPTVDQQAMDRAHRLGQTKQVTVYRLICKGSIEERILQRAREKSEIQKLVISGGNFKPDTLKPKEVVSLLLDDDELVQKYHLKVENKVTEEVKEDRKRKMPFKTAPAISDVKRVKQEPIEPQEELVESLGSLVGPQTNGTSASGPNSPGSVASSDVLADDQSEGFAEEIDSPITNKYTVYNVYGSAVKPRVPGRGSSRRGRPRGSRSRSMGLGRTATPVTTSSPTAGSATISSTSPSSSGVFSSDTSSIARVDSTTSTTSSQSSPRSTGSFMDVVTTQSVSSPCGTAIRRGPGRPRLKPTGPSNAGSRGAYRPRKPAKPLPVPLMADPSATVVTPYSSVYSYYDFADD